MNENLIKFCGMVFLLSVAMPLFASERSLVEDVGKTKTQLLNELKLRKAIVELNQRSKNLAAKKREFEVATELFNERIYTLRELNDAQKAYEDASMLYQQAELTLRETRLDFLQDATHISVTEARKHILPDGRRMVNIAFKNTSNVSEAETYIEPQEDSGQVDTDVKTFDYMDAYMSLTRLNSLLEVQNIIVSIYQNNIIIGKPYDAIISSLRLNEEKTVAFQLLEETDQITIHLTFLDKTMQVPVKLEADFREIPPIIEAIQFSQEAYLGEETVYSLRVERFSSGRAAFQLAVLNLPHQIAHHFSDATGMRLRQVSFQQNETSLNLLLHAFLPEFSDEQIVIDKPVEFWAIILQEHTMHQQLIERQNTQAQIDSIQAGKVKLELVPRGVGRIEIRAANLYQEIKTDEHVTMNFSVYNDGTRRINHIQIVVQTPTEWRTELRPDVIQALLPAKEAAVALELYPPGDVSVGDYEITIETKAMADNRAIETRPKVLRIHISARSNLLLSGVIMLSVIALIVGIVWYGVKITRR